MKYCDLIVQFAVLWGIELMSKAESPYVEEIENHEKMKGWDSIELTALLSDWKDEYIKQDVIEDTVEFFNIKLEELLKAN